MLVHNIYYFCAKLLKKVDTVKFIIGILIFIIGIASEIKKRSRKRSEAREVANFEPLPTTPPAPQAPAPVAAKRMVEKNRQPKPAPPVVPPPAMFEEGTRVTIDIDEQPSIPDTTDSGRISDREADDLRQRIIWGEILSRKF